MPMVPRMFSTFMTSGRSRILIEKLSEAESRELNCELEVRRKATTNYANVHRQRRDVVDFDTKQINTLFLQQALRDVMLL
jgi:hypothetical protein